MIVKPMRLGNSWTEIDLDAISHNVRELRRRSEGRHGLMAVVKGDAYGHGVIEVARACLEGGAVRLAVSSVWEGAVLRKAGFACPVLVLSGTPLVAVDFGVANRLELTVFDRETITEAQRAAQTRRMACELQMKVDSGMSRLGVRDADRIEDLSRLIISNPYSRLVGIFTHMAAADETDKAATRAQFKEFCAVVDRLRARCMEPGLVHVANSAVAIDLPEMACDLTRPGLALYGLYPVPEMRGKVDLRPALAWKSHVVQVKQVARETGVSYNFTHVTSRPSMLANIPVGYTDGYRRLLSGRGQVLIRGQRVNVVGRVCMDQMVVDVTDVGGVEVGDEVVLIGKQGSEEITVDEVAETLDTIVQEVLTLIGKRTARLFMRNGKVISMKPVFGGYQTT